MRTRVFMVLGLVASIVILTAAGFFLILRRGSAPPEGSGSDVADGGRMEVPTFSKGSKIDVQGVAVPAADSADSDGFVSVMDDPEEGTVPEDQRALIEAGWRRPENISTGIEEMERTGLPPPTVVAPGGSASAPAASDRADTDGDGLSDAEEAIQKTDPKNPDTDGDGLSDGEEVKTYRTNPRNVDTDGDGLADGEEVKTYKTNPNLKDTDGDGFDDGTEVSKGYNPLGPGKR